MATTPIPMVFTQGPLATLWDDTKKEIKTASTQKITNGYIYVGYDTSSKRAMLFTDINNSRYRFTADVTWNDIQNKPTNLATTNDINSTLTTVADTYLPLTGGTLKGTLWMDTTSTPFLIGKNEKIGMRASNNSNSNLGQINISNSWWDTGNQWGAQMSAYDGNANKYNQLRMSHEGLQYIIYNNADNSEKKANLFYNEQTESLDFSFT